MIRLGPGGAPAIGWLREKLGSAPFADDAKVIEATLDGQIAGVAIFDHWRPASVRLSMAAEGVEAIRALRLAVFDFAYRQADRKLIWAEIPSHSHRAQRLARFLGFTEAHRIRDGHAEGDDLIVYEHRRKES